MTMKILFPIPTPEKLYLPLFADRVPAGFPARRRTTSMPGSILTSITSATRTRLTFSTHLGRACWRLALRKPLADITLDEWNQTLTTNLTVAYLGARHQIPLMRKRGGGSIISTSSFVGTSVGLPAPAGFSCCSQNST
ncbi:TPA: SDR family oxidoreductase [Serratia fonticola]